MRSNWLFVLVVLLMVQLCHAFSPHPAPTKTTKTTTSSTSSTASVWTRDAEKRLSELYRGASSIRCPFFRRRAYDLYDGLGMVLQFLVARHKSLPMPVLPGCSSGSISSEAKTTGLSIDAVADIIKLDWRANIEDGKGYYITGRITKSIYRDDCLFDGPDPDMPVRGLRKYLSSASQLFDHKKSCANLLSCTQSNEHNTITCRWRIEGVLNLPWHPRLKPWTGSTTYYIDEDGLIFKHIETWDISVLDAFISTLFPALQFGAEPAAPLIHSSSSSPPSV